MPRINIQADLEKASITISSDPVTWVGVIANLKLALRHPENDGEMRERILKIIETIADELTSSATHLSRAQWKQLSELLAIAVHGDMIQ
jgi:hypothetical protein